MAEEHPVSAGVEALIDRLRDEGVEAGAAEAARIVDEAKAKAKRMLDDARAEVERCRAEALQEAQRERDSARAALRLAVRDTALEMKSQISARLAAQIRRLIGVEMRDPEFIRKLILAVASQAAESVPTDQPVEIRLAEALFTERATEDEPEMDAWLQQNLLGVSADLLREGVTLHLAGDDRSGIRIRLGEQDAEIDLSSESVSAILLERLLPRFRAIVEGIEDAES